jgi:hypothetical protein
MYRPPPNLSLLAPVARAFSIVTATDPLSVRVGGVVQPQPFPGQAQRRSGIGFFDVHVVGVEQDAAVVVVYLLHKGQHLGSAIQQVRFVAIQRFDYQAQA